MFFAIERGFRAAGASFCTLFFGDSHGVMEHPRLDNLEELFLGDLEVLSELFRSQETGHRALKCFTVGSHSVESVTVVLF